MNICIDIRSPGTTGIYSYSSSLLRGLLKVDQKNKYTIITSSRKEALAYEGLESIIVPSENILYWIIWSNTVLRNLVRKRDILVYHSFKHPTAFNLRAKKIVTLHGLHMHYIIPEVFKWYETIYWKCMYSMAARYYDRLITYAEAEKKYLVENLGFPEEKFRMTFLAADDRFRMIKDKGSISWVRERLRLPDNFILYVGQMHPRKNLEGIIHAYQRAKPRMKRTYKLVLVGKAGGQYFEKLKGLIQALGLNEDILFSGYLKEEELPYIYNLADFFLFPSRYENYGIVIMEAMASGLPVITSDIEDIREVVGDAAILVNPLKIDDISDAIVELANSPKLRETLTRKGLERRKMFSWDQCARETIEVYEELIQE